MKEKTPGLHATENRLRTHGKEKSKEKKSTEPNSNCRELKRKKKWIGTRKLHESPEMGKERNQKDN